MRRKKVYLIIAFVFAALFLCANSLLFAQAVVLNETDVKEDDSAVKIMFSTNRSIPVECYDLSVPPQVIVDFMGEIYTNKPEIMMVNKGVVKQMKVIRGTKKSRELDDSYYSVDFIIVDLKESMRYDFGQGLTTSVLVISKPGKIIDVNKAKNEVAKLTEQQIPVPAAVVQEQMRLIAPTPYGQAPLSMQDKEYEMPLKSVEPVMEKDVVKAPKRKRVSRAKTGRIRKQKKQKSMAEKSEAKATTIVGKMKKGIENAFAFGKNKEKSRSKAKRIRKAQKPQAAHKEEVKPERKVRKKASAKKSTSRSKRKKLKSRHAAKKVKKPSREKVSRARKTTVTDSDLESYLDAIADAKAVVEQKSVELDEAEQNMLFIGENLNKKNSARKTIEQRIKNNNSKQALLKDDYNASFKIATFAKNAANANWMEYSEAKAKFSLFLKNEVEPENLKAAQQIYNQKKEEMSQAIKAVESAKAEGEAKLFAYEQAVQVGNDLLIEAENQKMNAGQEQMEYNRAQEEVHSKMQKLTLAKKEVQKAERDLKQYEIDKAEEQYKESLFNIDQTLALEAEEEARRQEKARLKRIEGQKAKQMMMQQDMQAKEDAQLAALMQLQKNKESDPKQFLRRREEKAEPKRRRKTTVTAPKSKAEVLQPRTEVLSTAIELRNSGLEMQRNEDFDSAVKYYQQALISDPAYATVHNDLGILYEQKGLNEKARMEYLAALKINPQYVRAHSNLALLYEKSGDNNKAYYHWKQRVQLGRSDDPWTQKAKQRMELLEQQRK